MEEVEGQAADRMALSERLTNVSECYGDLSPATAPTDTA